MIPNLSSQEKMGFCSYDLGLEMKTEQVLLTMKTSIKSSNQLSRFPLSEKSPIFWEMFNVCGYSRSSHVHVKVFSPTINVRFRVSLIFKPGQSSLPLAGLTSYSELGLDVIFLCLVEQPDNSLGTRELTSYCQPYFSLCRLRSKETQPKSRKNNEVNANNKAKDERQEKKIESYQIPGPISFYSSQDIFPVV